MKLSISQHTENLTEFESILLRNHIGKAYNLAEDLENCNPSTDYDIQRRKVTDGIEPVESVVPILCLSRNSKDESHRTFKEAEEKSDRHNIDIHDVWYDNDENEMIIFIEPYSLE